MPPTTEEAGDEAEVVVSAEFWSIISVAIVILIAIATANRATRREVNQRMVEMRRELGGRIDGLGERMSAVQLEMSERFAEVNERIAAMRTEMSERFGEVRAEMGERFGEVRAEMGERFGEVNERIAVLRAEVTERTGRVEGLLEGIGYAQRKRTSKKRGGEHGAAPPQP